MLESAMLGSLVPMNILKNIKILKSKEHSDQ